MSEPYWLQSGTVKIRVVSQSEPWPLPCGPETEQRQGGEHQHRQATCLSSQPFRSWAPPSPASGCRSCSVGHEAGLRFAHLQGTNPTAVPRRASDLSSTTALIADYETSLGCEPSQQHCNQ